MTDYVCWTVVGVGVGEVGSRHTQYMYSGLVSSLPSFPRPGGSQGQRGQTQQGFDGKFQDVDTQQLALCQCCEGMAWGERWEPSL
jgi:hypothetical protein